MSVELVNSIVVLYIHKNVYTIHTQIEIVKFEFQLYTK